MTNNKEALPRTTDVLVIGYGPVGAALCALLGRYGVTTLVVDKVAEVLLAPAPSPWTTRPCASCKWPGSVKTPSSASRSRK